MNPAAEAQAKAQQKWPGAAVVSRGRKYILHQHPTQPNRYMLDTGIGPIHYGPGEDQEIDTAWQPTAGAWDWEMTANGFQTYARNVFNVGDLFRFEKNGESLAFDPQSINWIDENNSRQQIAIKQPVAAAVNDDTLTWSNAYGPGRHFGYQNQTARLRKLLTIDTAGDLPPVTLQGNDIWLETEFSMSLSPGIELYLDGQLWTRANGQRVRTAGNVEIRNTAGDLVLWWLGLPRAYDSDINYPSQTIGQIEVRRQGGPSSLFITIRIPKTWIDAATFPIYIDPTVDEQVGANTDDAQEDSSGNTTTNAGGGTYDQVNSVYPYYGARFQTVAIEGTIDVAYVEIYVYANKDDPSLDIYAEDVDDSTTFTAGSTNHDISGRTLTTASTSWQATNIGWSAFKTSPSIVYVIQEIVDRGSWSSGNDINIIMVDDGGAGNVRIGCYDNSSSEATKLHVEYSSSGSPYTLTCEAGSLSFSGTAATFINDHPLTAAAGTLDFAATIINTPNHNVLLYHDAILDCQAGALTLAGQDCDLIYSEGAYDLTCEAGTIEFAATIINTPYHNVWLYHDAILDCEAGTLTFSGTATGLVADQTLECEAGPLTFSGTAATFLRGETFSLAAGTLTISGRAAGLVKYSQHAAAAGALTFAGTAAGLVYSGAAAATVLTADLLCNPSPTLAMLSNVSPAAELESNPSPAVDIEIA